MPGRLKTYGYVNAKIRARLSGLLSGEDFEGLIKAASADEAVLLLKSGVYSVELSRYAATGDVRAVEFALRIHEITLLSDITEDLPGEAGRFTTVLLLRYEVETLKNALRLWFERSVRGRDVSGGSSYLYRARIVHEIDYDKLVDARDIQELQQLLDGTPYPAVLKKELPAVESAGHLFPVETALDRFYFSRLHAQALELPAKDREIALRIIGVEIDLLNIDRIVRFVSFYRPAERSDWNLFLPGGQIPEATLKAAYSRQEAAEALTVLLSGTYGGYRGLAEGQKSNPYAMLHMVEEILRRILYDEVKRLLWGYPFTIGTVMAYLFLKRKEIRSIVRILNAKQYGLSEERIREGV